MQNFNGNIKREEPGGGGGGGALYLGYTKKGLAHPYPFVLLSCPDTGGGRVVRWSWVNFQCRGVLHFG